MKRIRKRASMINRTISSEERSELLELIRGQDERGMTVSEVVVGLERAGLPPSRVKYIVRRALDRGEIRTDRNFKLHPIKAREHAV
jgi:hypothetical protein